MDNKSKWLVGPRKTTNKPTTEMCSYELMLNNCYVDNQSAMYRDFDESRDIRSLIRDIAKSMRVYLTDDPELLDTALFEYLEDELDTTCGVLGLLYSLLWSKAELYESLKRYEDAEERGEIGRVPRWIPVTERPPEKAGDYLCVCNDGESGEPYVAIIQYNDEREAFGHEVNVYDSYTLGFVDTDFEEWPVTYWMPIPAAPEVK